MAALHPLAHVIQAVGLARLARALGISPQAIRKWERAGRMPRTEWTGETDYSSVIVALAQGAVSRRQLLGPWPPLSEEREDDAREPAVTEQSP